MTAPAIRPATNASRHTTIHNQRPGANDAMGALKAAGNADMGAVGARIKAKLGG